MDERGAKGQINVLDGMDGESIIYKNLDDPELQKVLRCITPSISTHQR